MILAGAGAVSAAAGCGGSDTASDAVRGAGRKVQAVSIRDKAPAPSLKKLAASLDGVAKEVKPALSEGLPGETAAANLINARATAGLAAIQAEEAAAQEREAASISTTVRAAYDTWLLHQGRAAALEQFDPSKELASIDADIKTRVQESTKVKADKQTLDDAVAQLETRAKDQLDKARAERDAETALRQQAVNAGAVQRAKLITQANEHRRASDGFDKEASLLRAQAATTAPEARDKQSEIERLTAQSKLLADAKADLVARQRANAEQAKAERDDAAKSADAIKAAVAELAKVREKSAEPSDKAAKQFGQAFSAVKSATSKPETDQDTRTAGKLAGAGFKHSQADVLATRAMGLAEYASVLRELADVSPPLPDAASYQSQASSAEKQAAEAREAAKAAYAEAQKEYEGVAARPEVKDRLAKLAKSLETLGSGKGEIPAWLAAKPVAGSPSAAGKAAAGQAPSGAEAEVRRSIEEVIAATMDGKLDRLVSAIDTSTPEDQKLVDMANKLVASIEKMNAACKEKFGSSLGDLYKQAGLADMAGPIGGMAGGMKMPSVDEIKDIDIEMVDASTARLSHKGDAQTLLVKKVGGDWKLVIPPEAKAGIDQVAPMADAVAQFLDAFTADIKAGKFANANEMMNAMQQRANEAIMAAMTGGAGGGPRPPRPGKPGSGG